MNHLNNRFTSPEGELNSYAAKDSEGEKSDKYLTFFLIAIGLFGLYYVPKAAFSQPSGEEVVDIRLTGSNFSKKQTAKLLPNAQKQTKKRRKQTPKRVNKKKAVQLPLDVAVIGSKETGNQLEFFVQGLEKDQAYVIDFGDGNQQAIQSSTFQYTYENHGQYEIKLSKATDDQLPETSFKTVLKIESPVLSSIKSEKSKI